MNADGDGWLLAGAILIALLALAFAGLAYFGSPHARTPLSLRRRAAMDRERFAAANIPYTAHVHENVVKTKAGDYVQGFRLVGASFESADDEDINNWHERLNILWRNIASDQVALWTHVVRRRESVYPAGESPQGFSRELDAHYRQRVAGEILMANELYVSVVYRPQPGAVSGTAMKLLARSSEANREQELRDSLEACAKLRAQLLQSLDRYEPELLGLYEKGGRHFSSLLEYFALLLNGEWRPVPLPRSSIDEVLVTTRPFFGAESMEYRMPTQTRIGAFLGIKEYPTPTQPGMFNLLLRSDFPFVLTQSFTFLPKASAQRVLATQYNRMRNAADLAVSQAEQLNDALDALASNEFCMGDHHFTLHVLADPFEGVKEAEGRPRLKQLLDHVAAARNILAETGMVVAREDLAMEAGYWAQLPANFAMRTRKAPITSRNFAGMVPFHNFPTGRAVGNHWGDALTMLITSARSPYYFSLHASDPRDPEGGSRKDIGHTSFIGPTGAGKTVAMGFMACMLRKTNATQVLFDKDRGLEILVRAEGGRYLALKDGTATGMNPLQLEATATNLAFLKHWLRALVQRADRPFSVREENDLDTGLRGVLKLPVQARRLSRLLEFLDPTDPEGMYARLSRWTEKEKGDYAWVFDNREDQVVRLLDQAPLIGFDVTDFLDNPTTRGPVTMYLFHIVRRLLDGRRLVVWMDEFAKLLADPSFESFAKDGLKTWRKLNGVAAFATQSPSDVLASPIARTLIEQTATKIFFPNADANEQDYREGFGLSEQEYRLLKEGIEPGSRMFLIKQGHQSVVCELNLKGFDYELNVISGRAANVELMNRIIAEVGPDPAVWLPRFREATAKGASVRTLTAPTLSEQRLALAGS
ncbi:MAG: VirB4 family type IV secretion/conjugal transfer ATPase [Burkholderiales bacterium]